MFRGTLLIEKLRDLGARGLIQLASRDATITTESPAEPPEQARGRKPTETYYVDASALMEIYSRGTGLEAMANLLKSASILYSSVVTYPQVLFALRRKLAGEELTLDGFQEQVESFEGHFRTLITRVNLSPANFTLLSDRTVRFSRTELDAVHLACALWLNKEVDPDCRFVSSDHGLLDFAEREGLLTFNPQPMP